MILPDYTDCLLQAEDLGGKFKYYTNAGYWSPNPAFARRFQSDEEITKTLRVLIKNAQAMKGIDRVCFLLSSGKIAYTYSTMLGFRLERIERWRKKKEIMNKVRTVLTKEEIKFLGLK